MALPESRRGSENGARRHVHEEEGVDALVFARIITFLIVQNRMKFFCTRHGLDVCPNSNKLSDFVSTKGVVLEG